MTAGSLDDAPGKPTPAAAYFQHPFATGQRKQIDHAIEFGTLGVL